jgi:predicted metal-dependent hydrolase
MAESRTIHIEDIGLVLFTRNPRAKRLIIKARPLQGIRITVPGGLSFARAEQMAMAKMSWMKEQALRMKTLEPAYRNSLKRVAAIDRQEAARILTARLEHIARVHGYTYNRVSVRSQKTRWGSCSGNNNISLNIRLLLLPEELCNYVLLHELVHTMIKNHGPVFWREMHRSEPRAGELAALLRHYRLHLM